MIIYLITNKVNGKQYVGQTIHTLNERWANHCSKNSGCVALKHAIDKYGKNMFDKVVIDTASSQEELDEKEKFWIKALNTMSPNGYNLTSGGEHAVFSDEVKEKLRVANTGKKHSEETRKLISQRLKEQWRDGKRKGRPMPERYRYLLRDYTKEHGAWNKGLPKEQSHLYGKKRKDSTKRKIAETLSRPVICVETGVIYPSSKVACDIFGLHQANLSKCLHGERERTGGYHWRFADGY